MRKHFFYQHKTGEALAASCIGFLLILLCTGYTGIGVSPDSVVYTSVARNLHAGKGFTEFSGLPIVQFPVFFPAFLGLIYAVSDVDPILIAPYLNGLIFAAVIFCCGLLIDQFPIKNRWYKRLMLLLIALSPSLLEIYEMIWSETLFILLSVLFMLKWQIYTRSYRVKNLLFLGSIAAVSVITRYAGITLIFTGCLLLLIDQNLPSAKKIKHFFLFGFIAVSLLLINLVRNAVILGTVTGERQPGNTRLIDNLQYFGTTISGWLTLPESFPQINFVIGLFFLAGFLLLLILKFKNAVQNDIETVLISFFLIYVLFILLTSTISRYETINNRLLAPAFIPLLLGATSWTVPILKKHRQKQYTVPLYLIGLFFIYSIIDADYQQYTYDTAYGIPGYTDDSWNKSEIATFLKKHPEILPANLNLTSNDSAALYFITGSKCFSIPDKHYPQEIKNFRHSKNQLIIWFDQVEDEELLSLQTLKHIKPLQLLYRFKDGSIYKSVQN